MNIDTALVFVLMAKLVQGDGLMDPASVGVVKNDNDIGNRKNVENYFIDSENDTIDEWTLIQHFVVHLFSLEDKGTDQSIDGELNLI